LLNIWDAIHGLIFGYVHHLKLIVWAIEKVWFTKIWHLTLAVIMKVIILVVNHFNRNSAISNIIITIQITADEWWLILKNSSLKICIMNWWVRCCFIIKLLFCFFYCWIFFTFASFSFFLFICAGFNKLGLPKIKSGFECNNSVLASDPNCEITLPYRSSVKSLCSCWT